ncbi:hypothetical protein [Micromonospora inaquosa]|uniref:Uncharacterized protein n=1 Tax=Micromonospora inaquosa TaxID=2203716 RepID=A0A3N9WB62_9ACTN|nr:hypothetical protein [Micromonospora inaquosa]RQW98153.1 hypothetical protein DLJ59_27740 [Micromonospora inaquosa]
MPELSDDVAALLHTLPRPLPADADADERDLYEQELEEVLARRADTARRLREVWITHDYDPLLFALGEQQRAKAAADERIRLLVAYAREFVSPRPYTQEALAIEMEVSPSAVRGAYDHQDVEIVASATGRRTTVMQQPAGEGTLNSLIAELEDRTSGPGREHVAGVAQALLQQGWTPYPPVRRTPNPKYASRYVRWERRWPFGTVISLYQEPAGFLGTYARMAPDDPRWFSMTYGINAEGEKITAADVATALAAYADRVNEHDAERGPA